MKVCKFCGAENIDSASTCSGCGGNKFQYKCGNCGTLFDTGNFCPKCGVKIGSIAKKCPRCGKEYYSAACPDCGYTPNSGGKDNAVIYTASVQPTKKKNTWLWVLGWICIFPVPLTILMLRNQKIDKKIKVGVIAAAWILYLIIAFSGDSNNDTTNSNASTDTAQTEQVASTAEADEESVQSQTSEEAEVVASESTSDEENLYSQDDYVNLFIAEYNAVYPDAPITGISEGNIKQKSYAYAGGCSIELLDSYGAAADNFNVSIYGGTTQEATDSMFAEFPLIMKILDPTLTDEQIDTAMSEWQAENHLKEDYAIGDNITCTFVPMVELSKGMSSSRIDIACSNYGK